MKRPALLLAICAVTLAFSALVNAQGIAWTVITTSGDTLRPCSLGRIDEGLVPLVCEHSVRRIPVDSVRCVIRQNETHFLSSAGYGALLGTAAGAIIGLATYEKPNSTGFMNLDFGPGFSVAGGAFIGAIGGFALGGAIGLAAGGDEVHDLTNEMHVTRVRILTELAAERD